MEAASNPAAVPTPFEDKRGDDRWMSMHQRFLAESKEREPDIVFIGDYTVALLAHTEVWDKLFVHMHCLNLGIAEDETQHVLWRINNGELESVKPKIIVLSVGGNNYNHTANQIVDGIASCTRALTTSHPDATLVVLKPLPSGRNPNPVRQKMAEVGRLLPLVLQDLVPNVQVISLDPGFVSADGTISHHDLYDYLHLTRHAYLRAFEPLADLLQQLLFEIGGGDVDASFTSCTSVDE